MHDANRSKSRVEFTLPPGFKPPPQTKEGDSFKALVTLHLKPGGKVCVTMLDDSKLPGYAPSGGPPDESEEETEPAPPGGKEFGAKTAGYMEE